MTAKMAFYVEYPHRKLPHGLPPLHASEPPNLSSAVVDVTVNVAKTAQQMSPICRSGQPITDKSPLTQFHKMKQKVKKDTKKDLSLDKKPQVKSILYPSRALSPRLKNNKRVNWPDITPKDDDDSQKQQEGKTCLSAAVNEVMVSFSLVLCCGGESERPEVPHAPGRVDLSALETVHELDQSSDRTLTVRTDLLSYQEDEVIDVDPILSFRDKKLKRKKRDPGDNALCSGSFTFSSDDEDDDDDDDDNSILEQRDELSIGEDDWAPVTRQIQPPSPVLSPAQQKLRNEAYLRYDQLHDYLLQQVRQTPLLNEEQTPRIKNPLQEIESCQFLPENAIEETQSQSPLDTSSRCTWSTDDKPIQRKSHRRFGFKARHKKKKIAQQEHFAEIEWKNAGPPSPHEITHVSEIPWKTQEGRHVSKLKREQLTKRELERQPSNIQTDLAREWEEEIKEVIKSPPRIQDGLSWETEDDEGDKYTKSCRIHGGDRVDPGRTGNEFIEI